MNHLHESNFIEFAVVLDNGKNLLSRMMYCISSDAIGIDPIDALRNEPCSISAKIKHELDRTKPL